MPTGPKPKRRATRTSWRSQSAYEISRDELLALMGGGKDLLDLEAEIARLGKGRGVEAHIGR